MIGHRFGFFPAKRYICFAWVEFTDSIHILLDNMRPINLH